MWEDVIGFEGLYKVNENGQVMSCKTGRIKATKKNNRDYTQIHLYKDGHDHMKLVHRVVADAFIPNPNQYKQINHKDEDKNNNHVSNLEWCTNLYNRHYGTGYQRSVEKHDYQKIADSIRRTVVQMAADWSEIKTWHGVMTAARATGVGEANIRRCCYGKSHTAGGYRWKYADGKAAR